MLRHMASIRLKSLPMFTILSKNSTTLFSHSRNFNSLSSKPCRLLLVMFAAKNRPSNPSYIAKRAAPYSTPAVLRKEVGLSIRPTSRKQQKNLPDRLLRAKLDMCTKKSDLPEALRLLDEARAENVTLNAHHYNCLLYMCSMKSDELDEKVPGRFEKGFELFKQMAVDKVVPDEAAFTNASRLAALMNDPALAFNLLKQMKVDHHIIPKLRSYGPALFGFCEKRMADEAYEVDLHMLDNGVVAEEPELAALLRLSSEVQREHKVYEMVHRLREAVRQVSEETAATIEDWFRSTRAAEVGAEKWDVEQVKKATVEGGGGWHGQGWLGRGNWTVSRTTMNKRGVCKACGEKLVSIDIDPKETENFAKSLAVLAAKKDIRDNFLSFQEWLQRHGPFDAVVDGANIALANQHVFSFKHLNQVVNQLRDISPSKRLPLVILSGFRLHSGPAREPFNRRFLERWSSAGALYGTPQRSNDDWYWLYAAVSSKCFVATNDRMRDHLFALLGKGFFPRWQEKHQIRFTPSYKGPVLQMPPPYSNVIQESENGSWHIPTVTGDDLEAPRQWICATRAKKT